MYAVLQKKERNSSRKKQPCTILSNVIQRKRYTSDLLFSFIRAHVHEIFAAELDASELLAHVDDDPSAVMEVLKSISLLKANDTYTDGTKDENDDLAYNTSRHSQFLNPTVLRINLNAVGYGGEAHHIIPSCVAETLVRSGIGTPNDYNGSWNGVILSGSFSAGNGPINPLKVPNPFSAFHRNNGQHNHPNYNRYVIGRIGKTKDFTAIQNLAENILLYKIMDCPAGSSIDSIS